MLNFPPVVSPYMLQDADEPTKRKLKPKHPLKVHVWWGISRHGATKICIFDGIMDADLFCNILETVLIPFIRNKLPDHRFMQDNNPKHTSRRAQAYFEEESINWWRTPPESPDLNPIEELWHELKFYLESKVKPPNKQELAHVGAVQNKYCKTMPELAQEQAKLRELILLLLCQMISLYLAFFQFPLKLRDGFTRF